MTNKAGGDAGTDEGESMPPGGSPGGSSVRSRRLFGSSEYERRAPGTAEKGVVNLSKLFRKGKYDDAALLKRPGMSVDVGDKFGNTLLVACQNGHGQLAKMCVRYGADVNAANNKRNTALHTRGAVQLAPLADFRGERRGQGRAKRRREDPARGVA